MRFDDLGRPLHWTNVTDDFVDDLAVRFAGRRILEVFSGNGWFASRLAARGVDVVATTFFSSHDGHDHGMHHPVLEMGCTQAIREFGSDRDLLLMAWPNATEAAVDALVEWGSERPVVYVGEMPVEGLRHGGYPGCASDTFFESIAVEETIVSYSPNSPMDRAVVLRLDADRHREAIMRRREATSAGLLRLAGRTALG